MFCEGTLGCIWFFIQLYSFYYPWAVGLVAAFLIAVIIGSYRLLHRQRLDPKSVALISLACGAVITLSIYTRINMVREVTDPQSKDRSRIMDAYGKKLAPQFSVLGADVRNGRVSVTVAIPVAGPYEVTVKAFQGDRDIVISKNQAEQLKQGANTVYAKGNVKPVDPTKPVDIMITITSALPPTAFDPTLTAEDIETVKPYALNVGVAFFAPRFKTAYDECIGNVVCRQSPELHIVPER